MLFRPISDRIRDALSSLSPLRTRDYQRCSSALECSHLSAESCCRSNVGRVFLIRQRWQIALTAMLALTVCSVGFCCVTPSSCEASACPAHERGGSCHQHSRHSGPQTSHECCHSPICLNAGELNADKDGRAAGGLQTFLPVVLTLRLVEPTESATRLAAVAKVYAPPSSMPIFLSIRFTPPHTPYLTL